MWESERAWNKVHRPHIYPERGGVRRKGRGEAAAIGIYTGRRRDKNPQNTLSGGATRMLLADKRNS